MPRTHRTSLSTVWLLYLEFFVFVYFFHNSISSTSPRIFQPRIFAVNNIFSSPPDALSFSSTYYSNSLNNPLQFPPVSWPIKFRPSSTSSLRTIFPTHLPFLVFQLLSKPTDAGNPFIISTWLNLANSYFFTAPFSREYFHYINAVRFLASLYQEPFSFLAKFHSFTFKSLKKKLEIQKKRALPQNR